MSNPLYRSKDGGQGMAIHSTSQGMVINLSRAIDSSTAPRPRGARHAYRCPRPADLGVVGRRAANWIDCPNILHRRAGIAVPMRRRARNPVRFLCVTRAALVAFRAVMARRGWWNAHRGFVDTDAGLRIGVGGEGWATFVGAAQGEEIGRTRARTGHPASPTAGMARAGRLSRHQDGHDGQLGAVWRLEPRMDGGQGP